MKLARPEVFHPRVVLAGWPHQPAGDGDDAGLVAALRRRGLHAHWLSWDDPDVSRADLVILRATRDYARRLDEFVAWTGGVRNLLNPPAVVAWNAHRRYLDDLANRGVPTLPSHTCRPGERLRSLPAPRVFVGPGVGSGTRRFSDHAKAAEYVDELHAAGQSALVQIGDPVPEAVLIFVGGRPSHAFTTQEHALRQGEPDFEIWDIGAAAMRAAAAAAGVRVGELLCARAHLVGTRLLELQLIDPSLGWRRLDTATRDRAQREFALSVQSALGGLGLGPFSHRRP
ncbi:hypothetical protein NJB1907f44_02860 [Mycobacterium marinum]|uniref:hypothetical protein n=1 Tax=Mycobacterium marinum TaxID=1781 RepID=UPI000E3B6803|nr:hypothetical protein [Mycobacterium marinum]RFZ05231.1 Cycloserine biosynthesis protein DcsG [Mycobacterium marinum]WCS20322.1 hypothetical protein MML61_11215 [Mycobacterium marinum]GJN95424.1 hypothetical protein NJB1907f34b_01510 [Mycobacterium marinum]GJN98875.1 hypothetical protein NJB1907E8_49930 [Mycobacterium marinum]GJO00755.1 hypothetical protein NJB1907E90_03240 [Mycobacterium marinum]